MTVTCPVCKKLTAEQVGDFGLLCSDCDTKAKPPDGWTFSTGFFRDGKFMAMWNGNGDLWKKTYAPEKMGIICGGVLTEYELKKD